MTYQLTTLPSGLRIASEFLPSMQSATLCFSFNVGARQETLAQHGIAHLLEHMAFKGTATRNAKRIAEEFDDIGGQINAYTSMEQTVYYAKVLHEHLPRAFEILADILQHSVFDPLELKREQDVIIQEIGMHQDSPEDLVFDYLHEAVFPNQPLGRTILGTPESVSGFTPDDLRGYMASHYQTGAMVVSAAGRVEHAMLERLVAEHLPKLSSQPSEKAERGFTAPGEKRVERDLEQLQVMLAYPGIGLTLGDEFYSTQLLSTILGGGMSSRLFQEVREKRGLAYTVQSFQTSYAECGIFGIYAATGGESAKELLPVLVEECRKLGKGVSDAELARAKNQMRAAVLMRRESSSAVAETIARHLQDFGRYRPAEEILDAVERVDAGQVRDIAAKLFSTPLGLATLGPEAEAVSLAELV